MSLLSNLKTLLTVPQTLGLELSDAIVAGKPVERGLSPTPTHWQPLAKRPRRPGPQLSIASSLSLGSGSGCSQDPPALPPWSSVDLAKAGHLIGVPAVEVDFDDEAEMRRVFALAYDVFRYKHVLQQALDDCNFFGEFPEHAGDDARAWLLLFDLYKRQFRPRDASDVHAIPHPPAISSRDVLRAAGLADLDQHLWETRVHLAAALARLRVKQRAMRLSQLLPVHLQDGRNINHEDALVTGWINTFKTTRQKVCAGLDRQGLRLVVDADVSRAQTREAAREGAASVTLEDYHFDPVVPNLVVCHPEQRDDLAQASLVRKCYLVLQDRAFCFGPAMLGKLLSDYDLSGCVAQTHIHSPRSTAYLATILADNGKVESVLAFGAGTRKSQYKAYFRKLGVTNAEIFEERFLDVHDSNLMDNVVAVLASPPNSYSAVTDPVDLVCSRGGDLAMLQQLTEPCGPGGGKDENMLQEQAATLRIAMAKPQVQFVVYETHSVYPAENERLVRRMVKEMNTLARERHAEEHRRAAWLASLAAASEQGVPGEKRAKQAAAKKEAKEASAREAKEAKEAKDAQEAKEAKESANKDKKAKDGAKKSEDGVTPECVPPAQDGATAKEEPLADSGSAGPAPPTSDTPGAEEKPLPGDPGEPAGEAGSTASAAVQPEVAAQEGDQMKEPPSVEDVNTSAALTPATAAPEGAAPQAAEPTATTAAPKDAPAPAAPRARQEPVIEVPLCDLFEIGNLPDMCPHLDSCLSLQREGCYLAIIKRKEIIRMDANYMIKMAEARGLFGCTPGTKRPTAADRARRKREREEAEARARGGGRRRAGGPLDVERLAAPTRASRARQQRIPPRPRRASNMSWESDDSHAGPGLVFDEECPRFVQHMLAAREASPDRLLEQARRRDARRWWSDTTRHMAALSALGSGLGLTGLQMPPGAAPLMGELPRLTLARSADLGVACAHRHPFPVRVRLLEL